MPKTLVTAKVNPDLDGTACSLAYAHLLNQKGIEAQGGVFGYPQSEVEYFIEKQGIKIPILSEDSQYENFILVDASSMKGMPEVVRAENVVEVIDHRKAEAEKEFPNAKIQIELIGAAASLIVERFIESKIVPTLDQAKLLYGAIFHNTLNFISSNVDDKDRKAIEFLEKEFNLKKDLAQEMFQYSTDKILGDIGRALNDDKKEFDPRKFGGSVVIGAYQLVVFDDRVLDLRKEIENHIQSFSQEFSSNTDFLNIIILNKKKSVLFSPDDLGQRLLSNIFDCQFKNGWTELDQPWLRKQIIPKFKEALNKMENGI